jgi:hypothetical protein
VDGGPLSEDRLELRRIHGRDDGGIEPPEPALEVEGTAECFLDRDLLVEHKADEEGQRLFGDEAVGSFVAGEEEACLGHARMVTPLSVDGPRVGRPMVSFDRTPRRPDSGVTS